MALPSNVSFGTVVGRFMRAVADGPDAGRDPDGIPFAGLTVKFIPTADRFKNVTATPPVTIVADPITATTDADGYLIDAEGEQGIRLLATDDEDLSPTGWTWGVAISGTGFRTLSFNFALPTDGEIDLATVVPVPGNPGQAMQDWLAAVAASEAAAASAGESAVAAEAAAVDAVAAKEAAEAVPAQVDTAMAPILADPESTSGAVLRDTIAETVPVGTLRWPRVIKMLTAFQTGHGWFPGGSPTSSDMNAVDDFIIGTQSARLTLAASGTQTLSAYPLPAFDATDRNFVLWMKVADLSKIQAVQVRLGSDTTLAANFLTMSASPGDVTNSVIESDEWTPLVFSPASASVSGAPNLAALRAAQIRVTAYGGGMTTLHFNGLAMVESVKTGPFPGGVVSLVWDDQHASTMLGARMQAVYGFPGTTYTIVESVGGTNRLTLAQLHELEDSYGWEVAGHAFASASHNAPNALRDLTDAELDADMAALKGWLTTNGFRGHDHFAYPKGQTDTRVQEVVGRYFSTGRLVTGYPQPMPLTKRMRVGALSVMSSTAPSAIANAISVAKATGTWLVILFHRIVPTGASGDIEYNQADFATVLSGLAASGVPVATVSDVIARSNAG